MLALTLTRTIYAHCVGIIIAIEHNNKSNNNYNRNYVLSISKFNKWFETNESKKLVKIYDEM